MALDSDMPNQPGPGVSAPADKLHHSHTSHIDFRWIFALTAVMICVAVAGAIYFGVVSHDSITQYRLMLLLVFFAIATISSLLFAGKAQISGTMAGLTLMVGGPSALWLVALIAFHFYYPEDKVGKVADFSSLDKIAVLFDDVERRDGWENYDIWKKNLQGFKTVLGTGESNTLRNLLWYTHFSTEDKKIDSPQITTVFCYFDKYVIKLQRISGNLSGDGFPLLFGSKGSNDDSSTGSVLLVGRRVPGLQIKTIVSDKDPAPSVAEYQLEGPQVDALIAAFYKDDNPPEGDYAVVDMKRYAIHARGNLDIGFVEFNRQIDTFNLSTIKPRQVAAEAEYPLSFRPDSRPPDTNVNRIQTQLSEWLPLLDSIAAGQGTAPISAKSKELIADMHDTLQGKFRDLHLLGGNQTFKFVNLLGGTAKGKYGYHLPDAQGVVLIMFLY